MDSHLARAAIACALFGLLVVTRVAPAAEDSERGGPLALDRAIALALQRHPALNASAYEPGLAQARIAQSGLRVNPELAFEREGSLEATLSLGQVIELGDKRGRRVGVARAGFDLVGVEQRALQLDVLAKVTTAFIDVVATQERVRFAGHSRELAQRALDAISARVAAGRTPEAERSRARIAVLRAGLDERQASSALRGARHALASLWGDAEPTFGSAQADLFTLPPVVPLADLVARIEQNPQITRFASQLRLQQAQLRLAKAQARPDLALSLGVKRLEEEGDTALVAGFSLPLPLFDRNQGAIREAGVRIAQTGAEREAALIGVRATVFALHEQLATTRERSEVLRDQAVPQARVALEQTRYGYDRGRFSFLELATAQQDLLALESAAIDAAADYHRLLAELERITSEPLVATLPEVSTP